MVIVFRSGSPSSITNHWLWSDEGCDFSTGRQSSKLHKENKKRTIIRSITIIILSQCFKSPNWFGMGIMKGITRINSSSASNHRRATSICKYKFTVEGVERRRKRSQSFSTWCKVEENLGQLHLLWCDGWALGKETLNIILKFSTNYAANWFDRLIK